MLSERHNPPQKDADFVPFQYKNEGNILNDVLRKYYLVGREKVERVSTGLASSKEIYTGEWLYNHGKKSCVAWALANAMLALNGDVDSELIKKLHLAAEKTPKGLVIPDDILERTSTEYAFSKFSYADEANSAMLKLAFDPTLSKLGKPHAFQNTGEAEKVWFNGHFLRANVSDSKKLVVGVNYDKFTGGLHEDNHGVAVVGYSISERGAMDVQFIDANYGKLWTSLEHFSYSILPERMVGVSLK